jgi:hypothetical protein
MALILRRGRRVGRSYNQSFARVATLSGFGEVLTDVGALHSVTARTTTQSRKAPMLIHSQMPSRRFGPGAAMKETAPMTAEVPSEAARECTPLRLPAQACSQAALVIRSNGLTREEAVSRACVAGRLSTCGGSGRGAAGSTWEERHVPEVGLELHSLPCNHWGIACAHAKIPFPQLPAQRVARDSDKGPPDDGLTDRPQHVAQRLAEVALPLRRTTQPRSGRPRTGCSSASGRAA